MKRKPLEIPDKFSLFGHVITVKKRTDLSYQEGAWGRARHGENTIEVQLATKAHPIDQTEVEQTYLHEVIHIVLGKLGYNELNNDEKFVDQLAGCLHQVLTQTEEQKKK